MGLFDQPTQVYYDDGAGRKLEKGNTTLSNRPPLPPQKQRQAEEYETYQVELMEVKHVVQSGETLYGIAAKYGIDPNILYEDNKAVIGNNPNMIYAGQELVIRTEGSATEETSQEEVSIVEEPTPLSNMTYYSEDDTVYEVEQPVEKKEQETVTETVLPEGRETTSTLEGYTGSVPTKSRATDAVKNSSGTITTDNQKYRIVPDSEYTKAPGTISESDYHLMIAQVAGEATNAKDDMLAVATTMLNRLENANFGNSIRDVLEEGYFPWGKSYLAYVEGGAYYHTDWGQEKLQQVTQAVDDALAGVRNLASNVYYYSGDGTYNYYSDIV